MYHEIGIEPLSNLQIQKLLRGCGVRVKHGKHHKLHVSESQHKKIHKAGMKGKSHTLTLDPYQLDAHQHLRGMGVMSTLKKVAGHARTAFGHAKSAYGHAKHGAQQASKFYGENKATLQPYGDILKKQATHRIEKVAHHAQPHLTRHLGEFGSHLGEHARSSASQYVEGFGEEPLERPQHLSLAEEEAMIGHGMRYRGGSILGKLGKTINRGASMATKGAISYAKSPEGRAMIQRGLQTGAEMALAGMGVKKHRGRPRKHKGGALFAAGYGGGMM